MQLHFLSTHPSLSTMHSLATLSQSNGESQDAVVRTPSLALPCQIRHSSHVHSIGTLFACSPRPCLQRGIVPPPRTVSRQHAYEQQQLRGRQVARFMVRHFIVSRHQNYVLKESRQTTSFCVQVGSITNVLLCGVDMATDRVHSVSSPG